MARHRFVSFCLFQWIAIALILTATCGLLNAQSLSPASPARQQPVSPQSQMQTGVAQGSAQTSAATQSSQATGASAVAQSGAADIAKAATPTSATFVIAPAIAVSGAPSAVASADLNEDGKLDLIVLNSTTGKLSVMLGKGDGTFGASADYSVGKQPTSVIAADFNGDGKLDLAVVNQGDGTISVLLGNGDGSLQSQTVYAGLSGAGYIAAADFNGDGKADLAISSASAQAVGILLNNGDGTFAKVTPFVIGTSPNWLATGDFDGDGKQDVAAANSNGTISILLGRGDGSFRSLSSVSIGSASLSSIAAGDFNNDGKTDLAVTQLGTKLVTVLLGKGDGSFKSGTPYNVGSNPAQIIVADVNGDKIPDLVTANQAANTFTVLEGNGDGTFQSPIDFAVGKSPLGLVAGDFDGDGKTDLAVANFGDKSVSVPLGNGDGTFKAARVYGADLARKAIAVGDLDGDGKPDLVVTNFCGADAACAGSGTATILLATSDGEYRAAGSYPLGAGPVSVALADLNGDKKLDLIAVNRSDKSISVLLGNGDGTFQSALSTSLQNSPSALGVGDFNGDGKIDLAIAGDCGSKACATPGQLTLMLGAGDGSFQQGASYAVGYAPVSIAVGDINADANLDLLIANACGDDSSCKSKGTATVLLGQGQGVFKPGAEISLGMSPSSVALGDLAGRKVLDLAVAYRGDNKVATLAGNGDGTFKAPVTYSTGTAPASVVIADFNRDSKADVAVANFKDATVSVLFGNGDGTLQPSVAYPVGAGPESLAAVQAAKSAAVDLVTTNGNTGSTPMGSDVTVLKNMAPNINALMPVFTNLTKNPTITYGDKKVTLGGTLCVMNGPCVPQGDIVTVTINNNLQSTMINDDTGDFTIDYDTTGLGGGTYTIDYHFDAQGEFDMADDQSTSLKVNPATPTVAVMSSKNPSNYGDAVTFSVTVAGLNGLAIPTGKVEFTDNGTDIKGCELLDLSNGAVSCTTSSQNGNLLMGGRHKIIAHYKGDSNYAPTDGTLNPDQQVNAVTPTVAVMSSKNPSNYGDPVTFSVTVTGLNGLAIPTGKVEFTDNGTDIKGCELLDLSNGAVSCTTSSQNGNLLTGGPHKIIAHYKGDSNYSPADGTLNPDQQVNGVTPTVAVMSSKNPSTYPDPVTFSVTVTGLNGLAIPTGKVEFTDNGTDIKGCELLDLSNGAVSCTTSSQNGNLLMGGKHKIVAHYKGDSNYSPTDGTLNPDQQVNRATPVVAVSTDNKGAIYGQTIDLTATVTGVPGQAIPGGKVTFTADGNAITACSSIDLTKGSSNSTAVCTISVANGNLNQLLPQSSPHTIVATYADDTDYGPATSPNFTQAVGKATPTTAITSSLNPSVQGQTVTFTLSITGVTGGVAPTGTVTFSGTSDPNCANVKLNNGQAVCSTTQLASGSDTVASDYSGDGNYTASAPSLTQAVEDFTMSAVWTSAPSPVNVTQAFNNTNNPFMADQQTITATASPANGLQFSPALQVTCQVMPAGNQDPNAAPVCSLNGTTGSSCNAPSTTFMSQGGSTSVTVCASSSTAIGAYNVVVTASDSSDNSGLSHTTAFPVNIGTLTSTQSVTSTTPANISVAFAGETSSPVSFICSSITGPDNKTSTDCGTAAYNVKVSLPTGAMSLPTSITVTIAASSGQISRLFIPEKIFATFWMGMPAIVLLGSLPFGKTTRRRLWQWLGMMLILISLLQIVACGGGSFNRSNLTTPPGNYSILIQGTDSQGVQTSAVVPFTVFGG